MWNCQEKVVATDFILYLAIIMGTHIEMSSLDEIASNLYAKKSELDNDDRVLVVISDMALILNSRPP